MPRIKALTNEQADPKARAMLEATQKKLGMVPNLLRTFANATAALEAYAGFSGALAKGSLPAKLREQIALVVGETNSCQYCLSAHSALGRMAGLSDEEIVDSRRGASTDRKTEAALAFARKVVSDRGHVSDDDVDTLRAAGFNDGDITEIVANVALNLFTNYFNHVAETEVDFPAVEPAQAAAACSCD